MFAPWRSQNSMRKHKDPITGRLIHLMSLPQCFSRILCLSIVHFTVTCLVAKPLNMSEAKGDIVMTQTMLLFKFKLLCYHANKILVSIPTWSTSASLQIKGLATKYPTVKWPIAQFQF